MALIHRRLPVESLRGAHRAPGGRKPIPVALLATATLLLTSQASPQTSLQTPSQSAPQTASRTWLRVRAAGLHGRTVELGDFRRGATALLSGADPVTDGLWLPLPPGADPSALAITPPLDAPPAVDVVALPATLSDSWAVVPLPLGAWGVPSLEGVREIHISRGQRGRLRAGSIRELQERASRCPTVRKAPAAMAFPARVADFEAGPIEPLGNRFGFFAGRGAKVWGERVRDAASTRLAITANLDDAKSYGGFWLSLAPASWLDDPEAGADARGLASIAIRGRGIPRGIVKISDDKGAKNDASVVVGTLEGAADPDGTWLRVLPLPDSTLDLSKLRSLVIDLTKAGSGTLELEEIVVLGKAGSAPPVFVSAAGPAPEGSPKAGLWVWNTKELYAPGSEWRQRLLATIDRWKLTEVYLQLPHQEGDKSLGDWNDEPRSAALAGVIGELHRKGVKAHALDGAAWLALPESRDELLALARSVRDYNAAQPEEARFDAIHLDIEPYLLPTWGGRRRPELAASLVEGLTGTKKILGALPLWLDIPFWYDSTEETTVETGERAGCAKADLLRELFRISDGIGVMSYRTRADGADGLTSTALSELALGRELGKPVRLGIETIKLPLEEGWDAALAGPAATPGKAAVALPVQGPGGYSLFTTSATESELRWLKANGYRIVAAEPSDSAPPSKITFFGRTAEEIRAVVDESLELARRSGVPADGVAYHELRALP
ncbi:MAG: hypothetical protein NDJ92_03660 [Thermoanaerobaculia bacterium]|nr:hypothetical protein [Thermoanaerobaculia bacterium]